MLQEDMDEQLAFEQFLSSNKDKLEDCDPKYLTVRTRDQIFEGIEFSVPTGEHDFRSNLVNILESLDELHQCSQAETDYDMHKSAIQAFQKLDANIDDEILSPIGATYQRKYDT